MVLDVLHRATQGVTADTLTESPSNTGYKLPTQAETINGSNITGFASGGNAWSNQDSIFLGGAASILGMSGTTSEITSEILRGFDFEFDSLIPQNANILGFDIRIGAWRTADSGRLLYSGFDSHSFVVNDGGLQGKGDPFVSQELTTDSNAEYDFGGSTFLANAVWSREEVVDIDFSLAIRGQGKNESTNGAKSVNVSSVEIRVHYQVEIILFYLDGPADGDDRTLANASAVDGQEYPYRVDETGVGWEINKGIYRANSGSPYIERNTPLLSSEVDNSMVTFGAGAVLQVDLVGGLANLQEAFGVN